MKHILRTITRRLYRDRRRLAFVCVVMFAAGALTQWGAPNYRGGPVPSWLVFGLSYAVVFTIIFGLKNLVLPSLRHVDEIAALALLGRSILGIFYVDFSLLGLGDVTDFAFFVVIVMIVCSLYFGQPLDRYWPKSRFSFRYKSTSSLPADVLFDGIITYPEGAHRNVSGDNLLSCLWEDKEAGRSRLEERVDASGTTVTQVDTFSELDPPRSATFRFEGANSAPGALMTTGEQSLILKDKGRKRQALNRLTFDRIAWRAIFFVWIDDSFGRVQDKHVSTLEKREAKGAPPLAEPEPA